MAKVVQHRECLINCTNMVNFSLGELYFNLKTMNKGKRKYKGNFQEPKT